MKDQKHSGVLVHYRKSVVVFINTSTLKIFVQCLSKRIVLIKSVIYKNKAEDRDTGFHKKRFKADRLKKDLRPWPKIKND